MSRRRTSALTAEPTVGAFPGCRGLKSRQPPQTPRFPSSPEARRAILAAIASKNEKYARPFDQGNIAVVSLIGTESWSDYGAVVLQMAILDTLMSIETKLTELLKRPGDAAGASTGPAQPL